MEGNTYSESSLGYKLFLEGFNDGYLVFQEKIYDGLRNTNQYITVHIKPCEKDINKEFYLLLYYGSLNDLKNVIETNPSEWLIEYSDSPGTYNTLRNENLEEGDDWVYKFDCLIYKDNCLYASYTRPYCSSVEINTLNINHDIPSEEYDFRLKYYYN